jgi:hypothetical protein
MRGILLEEEFALYESHWKSDHTLALAVADHVLLLFSGRDESAEGRTECAVARARMLVNKYRIQRYAVCLLVCVGF